jgi:hypothetical protein
MRERHVELTLARSDHFPITLLLDSDLDDCPLCAASAERGWTCEDHPDKPWRHSGCSGAGAPCVCNPRGAALWAMVYSDALRAPAAALRWRDGAVGRAAHAGSLQPTGVEESLG